MFGNVATKIFGSRNQRNLKRMDRMVDLINSLEEQIAGLMMVVWQPRPMSFAGARAKVRVRKI